MVKYPSATYLKEKEGGVCDKAVAMNHSGDHGICICICIFVGQMSTHPVLLSVMWIINIIVAR